VHVVAAAWASQPRIGELAGPFTRLPCEAVCPRGLVNGSVNDLCSPPGEDECCWSWTLHPVDSQRSMGRCRSCWSTCRQGCGWCAASRSDPPLAACGGCGLVVPVAELRRRRPASSPCGQARRCCTKWASALTLLFPALRWRHDGPHRGVGRGGLFNLLPVAAV